MAHPAKLPPAVHNAILDSCEVTLAAIGVGKDAALVEAMAEAAHRKWRAMMGRPLAWSAEVPAERDALRLGMHAALLAAREFSRNQRTPA